MSQHSRTRINFALVVIVASLAALAYFRPGAHKPDTVVPLTDMQAADIKHIRIERPGQAPVTLSKEQGGWQVTSPLQLPADDYQVQNLLDAVGAKSQSRFPVAGADLGRYGLKPPDLKLWLNNTEFDFGEVNPVSSERYVRAADTVHLVSGLLYYRAAHDAYWWLDKRLLPAGMHLTSLQLPQHTLTLSKDGKWQLAPADPSVSADAIQQMVEAWENASAMSVAAVEKNARPSGEVSLMLRGRSAPIRFEILKDKDDAFFILARPDLGVEYELDSSQSDTLLKFPAPPKTKAAAAATR